MGTRLASIRMVAVAGVAAGVLAGSLAVIALAPATARAAARPIVPSYLTQELAGPHFVVHFTETGGSAADRISGAEAATLLGFAETAYAWEVTQQNYPAPLDDGDGKTDIYVSNAWPMLGGAAAGPDSNEDVTTGFVLLSPTNAHSLYPVSHEFFHVIQFGIYQHAGFFTESTAEWAGQAVIAANGASPPPNWFGDPQTPLDCISAACNSGYHGSIFWEYLSEHFGNDIALEAYDRDAALAAAAGDHGQHDVQALGEVLAAHGSSLAAAFEGYALAAVAGQITRPGVLPHAPAAETVFVAGQAGEFPPYSTSVDHLAMKVIGVLGAEPGSSAPCTATALHVQVALPAGVPTAPVFVTYPASGLPPASGVYPLAINGATAGAEIPWTTCAASVGLLALPNASTSTDAQAFTVRLAVTAAAGPLRGKLRPPRLSGKRVQRVGKLSVRVRSATAVTLDVSATVQLPRHRRAIVSRRARSKAGAGRTVTVHLRFAAKNLKAIEAALAAGKHLRAKIHVSARNSGGEMATATRTVRLKP